MYVYIHTRLYSDFLGPRLIFGGGLGILKRVGTAFGFSFFTPSAR